MRKELLCRVLAIVLSAGLTILAGSPLMAVQADQHAAQDGVLHFTVLHTNDEHSALVPFLTNDEPEQEMGGFARLATAVSQIREAKRIQDEPVLLFSGGDFLGETAYGWLSTRGYAPEIKLMQMMGYDAVTIGNHEYDFGPDILGRYLMTAGYPQAHDQTLIVASNTIPPDDYLLASENLIRENGILILENGLKIGIFGLIGEDAIHVTSDSGDIDFPDQHETAREQVALLNNEGADVIVLLSHSGEDEEIELAKAVPGIDLIIGGHSHSLLSEPILEGDTIIVQAGYQARYLGQLELSYHRESGTLSLRNDENQSDYIIPIDDRFAPDPEIQARIESYTQTLNAFLYDLSDGAFDDVHAPLVYADFDLTNKPDLQESTVGNFIADGMRLITSEITGRRVDVAIQANGSIRTGLVPKNDSGSSSALSGESGSLSFYDVTNTVGLGYGQDEYPGYSVVAFYLTGEELRRVLEIAALMPMLSENYFLQFSGLRYNYSPVNITYLTVPFINQPVPTTRAAREAWLYRGEGFQPKQLNDDYQALRRGDEDLYYFVTDTYILSFLPMAGEVLPQLEVAPRDENGHQIPPDRFDELTISYKGRELKVWETVAMYAASLPAAEDDRVYMPDAYRVLSERINPVRSFPLVIWLLAGIVFVIAVLVLLIRFIIKIRKKKPSDHPKQQPSP